MAALHLRCGHWFAVWPAPLFRKISKRTSVARDFFELGKKCPEQIFIEAGADFTCKFEFFAFVNANQERAKILAGTFRIGVATDHELLFLLELKLDPGAAPFSWFISGANPLSNQTLNPELSSMFQEILAGVFDGGGMSKAALRLEVSP